MNSPATGMTKFKSKLRSVARSLTAKKSESSLRSKSSSGSISIASISAPVIDGSISPSTVSVSSKLAHPLVKPMRPVSTAALSEDDRESLQRKLVEVDIAECQVIKKFKHADVHLRTFHKRPARSAKLDDVEQLSIPPVPTETYPEQRLSRDDFAMNLFCMANILKEPDREANLQLIAREKRLPLTTQSGWRDLMRTRSSRFKKNLLLHASNRYDNKYKRSQVLGPLASTGALLLLPPQPPRDMRHRGVTAAATAAAAAIDRSAIARFALFLLAAKVQLDAILQVMLNRVLVFPQYCMGWNTTENSNKSKSSLSSEPIQNTSIDSLILEQPQPILLRPRPRVLDMNSFDPVAYQPTLS